MSLRASNPIVNTNISSVHLSLHQVCATSSWILKECEIETFKQYKKFLELKEEEKTFRKAFIFFCSWFIKIAEKKHFLCYFKYIYIWMANILWTLSCFLFKLLLETKIYPTSQKYLWRIFVVVACRAKKAMAKGKSPK